MHTVSRPYASPTLWLTAFEGAPETCRIDRALEGEDLQVKQEVDIWSMGGVYSEVSALFRLVPTPLRYYVPVPIQAGLGSKWSYGSQLMLYKLKFPSPRIPTDSEMCR